MSVRRGWTWIALLAVAARASAGTLPPSSPVPGGIAVLPVASASEPAPAVWLGEHRVLVVPAGDGWRAIVGIALATGPGTQTLRIEPASGATRTLQFEVKDKAYATQSLTVEGRKVNPLPEAHARIESFVSGLTTKGCAA